MAYTGANADLSLSVTQAPLMHRLYNWTLAQAERPHAVWMLALISFAESSFFPIPPDVLLIPLILAAREKAWRFALVCTVASVVGGYAGYGIGALLYEAVAEPILAFYGYLGKFESFSALYQEWGAWIVAAGGLTPIPYKVITIASGAVHLDPTVFGVASAVSRGARFFLEAALLWYFGPSIRRFLEGNLKLTLTAVFVVGVLGVVALKWVF